MKNIQLIITALCCTAFALNAQEINYRAFSPRQQNVVALNFGADYTTVYGLSYARLLLGEKPKFVSLALLLPFGKNTFDDWKLTLSAQGEVLRMGNFSLDFKPGIVLRRYESTASRVYNIGLLANTSFGIYRPKWFVGAVAGYERSLSSHIRHGELRDYYPAIRDGWYGSTGGNFKFGIKTGRNFGPLGIALNAGAICGQDFKNNPTLPYYFDVSLSFAPKL